MPAISYAGLTYTLGGGTSVTAKSLGNGLIETRSTNMLLQTTSIQLGPSGSVFSLAYGYGNPGSNNGNVLSQTITRGAASGGQTFTQNYTYTDGLNRLTSAAEVNSGSNTGWSRTFGYDPWANGWTTAYSANLPPNSFTPQSPSNFDPNTNRLMIQNSGYDPAGNQTAIGGFGMTYDAENRMTSSTISQATTQYGYDGDGRRVTKTQGSQTATYVYDAKGELAAEYGGQVTTVGTQYVTADMLGSTRLVTDVSGNPENCYDYQPYGEQIPSATNGRTAACYTFGVDPLTSKFSGKERDAESGLDYFGARYVSSAQG